MATIIFSVLASAAAGALVARTIVRRELGRAAPDRAAVSVAPVAVLAPVAHVPPVVAAPAPVAVAPAPIPLAKSAELSPEILVVLSAAVAAFLGKRARIRSAHLKSGIQLSSAWAQQGRVSVQASHNLPHHTGGRF